MNASIFLAQLIGPLFLLVGIGVLLNRSYYRKMMGDFLGNSALYYFSGVLALVVGIAIVQFHNIWELRWPVVITVVGWLSILKGVVRVLLPERGTAYASQIVDSDGLLVGGAVVLAGLGAWLSFLGFTA